MLSNCDVDSSEVEVEATEKARQSLGLKPMIA